MNKKELTNHAIYLAKDLVSEIKERINDSMMDITHDKELSDNELEFLQSEIVRYLRENILV